MTEAGSVGAVRRRPAPALRGLVEPYWGYRQDVGAPGVHHGLPSPALTLVLAFDEPLDVGWLGDDASRGRHWCVAAGLHAAPALIRHDGRQFGIQLSITPLGARAFFGLPAAELAAGMVPLDALVGRSADALYDDAAGATTWAARFDALDAHLLSWAAAQRRRTSIRSELSWAWDRLGASAGATRVETLAAEVGWSRRHLTGQFRAEFGLAPKQLARVMRFESARDLLSRSVRRQLADVAFACGYADQAHLTREWRELAGYSPRQWLREESPVAHDRVSRA